MGCRQKMKFSSIITFIMIAAAALASKREFLVSATEKNSTAAATGTWVGSKYQIECTMCAACDNPCNTPSPPPPSPSPPPPSSTSNCPPPPSPPSSGSYYYYSPPPPPPSPSQSGSYPYYSPPPPNGIIGSYYPPPYKTYPSGPIPPPPNPIVPYFPFYYYNPPPPSQSKAVQLNNSLSFLIRTIFLSVFIVFLK
ncbi:hypothetical protein ACH5RR_031050 [Cinchona calisaya]|uniref:Uncharacterized protein n=1 Tax=Cinchona calisaya TaxID=153742 RepID=A0ABD2YJC9_9GENT